MLAAGSSCRLNSQAPDLHAEIRALAAAFELGAAARIGAAPNQEAEASALASEIAVRERLSMASVAPAVNVARRLGPLSGAPRAAPGTPTPGGWAGDSMAVGPTPQPPQPAAPPPYQPTPAYQPPQQPAPNYQQGYAPQPPQSPPPQSQGVGEQLKGLQKSPLAIGAAVLVAGFLLYQNLGGGGAPQPGPQPQPPPVIDNQPPPQPPPGPDPNNNGQQTAMPALQPPNAGGPMLQVQRHSRVRRPSCSRCKRRAGHRPW